MSRTYEEEALFFEDILTNLTASDAKLGPNFTGYVVGHELTFQATKTEMKRYGLHADMLGGLLPPDISMIFGAKEPFVMDVVHVHRLTYMENKAFRLGMDSPRSTAMKKCRTTTMMIAPDGKVVHKPAMYFCLADNRWIPTDERFMKVVDTKRVSGFSNRGGQWVEYEKVEVSPDVDPLPELATIAEWGKRMCWGIRFSAPSAPGVVAATDPIGVKELLRMRDVPEGKTRREALLHWVKDHWRQNRKDPDVEHQVRQHLRGAEKCSWFGLECLIVPSNIDVAKNTMATEKKWRKRMGAGRLK